jgi:endonuclease/exonuclease/phosphatase family metal-dependent hydrolase
VLAVALLAASCLPPRPVLPAVPKHAQDAISALTLNVLHGLPCAENDYCRAPDRAAITAQYVEAMGCPDLVGFQEIGFRQPDVFPPAMSAICDGRYQLAWPGVAGVDRTMIFTTLPILDQGAVDLAAFPWEAYWVRVDAPMGPVDFLTTHFASSANNPVCPAQNCPPFCPDGIRANQCNALEVIHLFDAQRDGAVVQIVSGDLNAAPDSPTYNELRRARYIDVWLAARRPECKPNNGHGCTGGRDRPENDVDGMDAPTGHYTNRIDYILARPATGCSLAANAKSVAATPLQEPFNGLYWPSDHAGVYADLRCR